TEGGDDPYVQGDADGRGSCFSYGRRGRVDRNASTFCRSIGVAQSSSKCALKGCSIVLIERRPASEQCMKTEIGCAPVDLKGQQTKERRGGRRPGGGEVGRPPQGKGGRGRSRVDTAGTSKDRA